ncbi:calcium-binding protein [Rhodovulum sulfidophilum]|uniref:calcium-binding protein n=1 Tax=Rhodovulum sulfidophilum TaxID=35806 RepID=UPI000952CB28|nr:hypothetical protein [Rhodovulum sulfidophilum]MBL3554530.1 hypothetical protein [Rhodovulum sulfidophilum]OLS48488.1 hypothetical protein BV379_09555 [Rhodovulum sulfidophilum]
MLHELPPGERDYVSIRAPDFALGETANRIVGNDLSNTITGNKYDDYISGGKGNDTLKGMDGDDVLSGGAGNDRLEGGNGDDALYGNTGTNRLEGGAGNDTYYGGDQDDLFIFDSGLDVVSSMYGADPGHDVLQFANVAGADLRFYAVEDGASLYITSVQDAADGSLDSGVIVEDYFAAQHLGLVDAVVGYDWIGYDLA